MTDRKQILGMAAALGANLIFGFSFVFSKMALTAAKPLTVLAVRFTVAFIALNLLRLTGAVKISLKGKPKKKLFLMSLAQPLFYFVFELYGLSLTSSALSGIIISLVPVGVILISTFMHERPTVSQCVCTVVSIAGVSAVSVLSDDGGKNHLLGILLLVGAVVSAAFFNILSRSESVNYTPFERTYFMFLVGCVGFNILAAVTMGKEYIPQLVSACSNRTFLIAIGYLAVISSVAAFMLFNYSTSVISSVRSASFSNIITVVTVLAGVMILKEPFSPLQFLLCVPIVLGVYGVNRTT